LLQPRADMRMTLADHGGNLAAGDIDLLVEVKAAA
jgi:hypothetical protein